MILPAMPAFYQQPKTHRRSRRLHGRQDPERARLRAAAVSALEGRVTRLDVSKEPARIAGMFDAIARRYDRLNHLLSAGLDRRWRRRAVDALQLDRARARARRLHRHRRSGDRGGAARTGGASVVGVDFAGEMLRLGAATRSRALGLEPRDPAGARRRDRHPARRRDRATPRRSRFGIRNVVDPAAALRASSRACSGPAAGWPSSSSASRAIPGIRTLYRWYFRYLLPLVGRLVSKHQSAYSYLPASVDAFPPPGGVCAHHRSHGFSQVRAVPLTFGIVYLYVAERR